MKLDSVRSLKLEFLSHEAGALASSARDVPGAAVLSRSTQGPLAFEPASMIGVGVAPGHAAGDYRLAVRLDDPALQESAAVRALVRKAKSEIDLRIVGRIYALALAPWNRLRVRPLESGISVGHYKITAGTLGAFIRLRTGGELRLLSNNHVFANVNRARRHDPILQPGPFDGGRRPRDVVARLDTYKRISFSAPNGLDAAIAKVVRRVPVEPGQLRGVGSIRSVAAAEIVTGEDVKVMKLGRTTEVTKGRIASFEMRVTVSFGGPRAIFEDQLEIESTGGRAFSRGGDSGSLVVTPTGAAIGLLFAGSDTGGADGLGLTYANPIQSVLDAFDAELITT